MIVIILFPTIVKKPKESKQYLPEIGEYFAEISHACYDVFSENNVKKRRAFFSEPLIKYLWKLFIVLKPQIIIHHLRRIRSFPIEGESRFMTLFTDLQETEKLCDAKLIPDGAVETKTIDCMSNEELTEDLAKTGKFNKKNTDDFR